MELNSITSLHSSLARTFSLYRSRFKTELWPPLSLYTLSAYARYVFQICLTSRIFSVVYLKAFCLINNSVLNMYVFLLPKCNVSLILVPGGWNSVFGDKLQNDLYHPPLQGWQICCTNSGKNRQRRIVKWRAPSPNLYIPIFVKILVYLLIILW